MFTHCAIIAPPLLSWILSKDLLNLELHTVCLIDVSYQFALSLKLRSAVRTTNGQC